MQPSLARKELAKKFKDLDTANFYNLIISDFINYKSKRPKVYLLEWKYTLLEKLEDFMDDTIEIVLKQKPSRK